MVPPRTPGLPQQTAPPHPTAPRPAARPQVQIARLSARINQISTHLRVNRKDFSSKRGLEAVLSQRKRLLKYLYRTDRCARQAGRRGGACEGVQGGGWGSGA